MAQHNSECLEKHLSLVATYIARREHTSNTAASVQQQQRMSHTEPMKLPSYAHDAIVTSLPARSDTDLPLSYFTDQRLTDICRLMEEQRLSTTMKQTTSGDVIVIIIIIIVDVLSNVLCPDALPDAALRCTVLVIISRLGTTLLMRGFWPCS